MDHDISLDDLLADAETELNAIEMYSLARAVKTARGRLQQEPEHPCFTEEQHATR